MQCLKYYINGIQIQYNITRNILDTLFKNVDWKDNESPEILDVGCGPGNITKEVLMPMLPENFKELVGVDSEEIYIKYANNTYSNDKVVFTKMNVEEGVPPGYEGRFDLVISLYYLHLMENQKRAMKSMVQCVKPGGNLILTFQFHKYLDDVLYEMSKTSKWADYMNPTDPTHHVLDGLKEEFITNLQNEGFKVVYNELRECETKLTKQDHIDFLRENDPFAPNIPKEKREEYFRYVVENYVDKGLTREKAANKKTFMFKYTLMIVHATKE